MSNWKDLGSGIMMWQPAAGPEVDDMSIGTLVAEGVVVGIVLALQHRDSQLNRCSRWQDRRNRGNTAVILPSYVCSLRTDQFIFQDLLGTSQTSTPAQRHILPATPSFSNHTLSESSGPTFITSSLVDDISSLLKSSRSGSEISISSPDFEDTISTTYDSDSTDFLGTPDTPCPVKHVKNSRSSTGATSRFFQATEQTKTALPIRRKLGFVATSVTAKPRSPR